MTTLLHDLRFGVRSLWRQKTLSLAAIATLGICIAAATTIFSIVNAVVLRPLPFPQPDRLAFLYNSYPRAGVAVAGSGVPDYYDCLEEKGLFEEVALFRSRGQTIGAGGDAERRTMMTVTPSLFRILQVKPPIGRAFAEEDAEIGNEHKIILGYELWQRLMGGSPDAMVAMSGSTKCLTPWWGSCPPDFGSGRRTSPPGFRPPSARGTGRTSRATATTSRWWRA